MKTYDKILMKDNIPLLPYGVCVVEEKIDGGNFRFTIRDGKLVFGTRTREIPEGNTKFLKTQLYLKEKLAPYMADLKPNWTYFGEACCPHTLQYDWDTIPPFIGFDIYDETNEQWLAHWEVSSEYDWLEIAMPKYDLITFSDAVLNKLDDYVPVCQYPPKSNPNQLAEGIVIKTTDGKVRMKYVRDEFKEKNAEVFGGAPKYNKNDIYDTEKFIFTYYTPARITKAIQKCEDEGMKVDYPLIPTLLKGLYEDIIDEHWKEILLSNMKLDFKAIRKESVKPIKRMLTFWMNSRRGAPTNE